MISIIDASRSQKDAVNTQSVDVCVLSDRLENEDDALIELTASMSKPSDALDGQSDALDEQSDALGTQTGSGFWTGHR